MMFRDVESRAGEFGVDCEIRDYPRRWKYLFGEWMVCRSLGIPSLLVNKRFSPNLKVIKTDRCRMAESW